jgi:hypothetical protein
VPGGQPAGETQDAQTVTSSKPKERHSKKNFVKHVTGGSPTKARLSGRNKPQSPRRTAAAMRHLEIVRLRAAGATFHQIKDALGYSSVASVHEAYRKAMAHMREEMGSTLAEERALSLERIDSLIRAVWNDAHGRPAVGVEGQPGYRAARLPNLGAVDRLVKLEERRAALLGLDQPKRFQHEGGGGGAIKVEDARTRLADLIAKLGEAAANDDSGAAGPDERGGRGRADPRLAVVAKGKPAAAG